ncbi:unnamed protein product [Hymenolepis diminuta]|uniref:Uncharacterized protein n=1 Tax=Hymenolepis diminuta TaxID=6216 RepID=A0A564Z1R3_HYMDI|nr:unnamed protein product [Hymenolepis diminuta]
MQNVLRIIRKIFKITIVGFTTLTRRIESRALELLESAVCNRSRREQARRGCRDHLNQSANKIPAA